MKRFSFNTYKELRDVLSPFYSMFWCVNDVGFIRFTNNKCDAVYLSCVYNLGKVGFIHFKKKETGFILDSFYITENEHLENRVGLAGELIAQYIYRKENDKWIYEKFVNGEKTDEYIIDDKDRKVFNEFSSEIDILVEKDSDEFKYFTKKDKDTFYLEVR